MDNNGVLIFWSILIIVALSLDALAYFVLRDQWKKHGLILADEFGMQIFGKLRQRIKTWREKLPLSSKPGQARSSPPRIQGEPAVRVIPASVKTVGQSRQVEFSMEMPLNSTIDVHIGATSEGEVNVEQREL